MSIIKVISKAFKSAKRFLMKRKYFSKYYRPNYNYVVTGDLDIDDIPRSFEY
jgi:hypothetical protein